MASPLLATHRATVEYIVAGQRHTYHAYCQLAPVLLGVYSVFDRDGIATIAFDTLAQTLWDIIRIGYNNAMGPPTVHLDELVSGVWVPIHFTTVVGGGSAADPTQFASQLTVVLRDRLFRKLRVEWMEMKFGYAGHTNIATGLGAQIQSIVEAYTTGTLATGPYRWQVSRSNQYIADSGPLAGVTEGYNNRIRRDRGLA